jgi:hypothetical protein
MRMVIGLLDAMPLWAVFVVTLGLILLSVEIGHRVARYQLRRSEGEKESSVRSMAGSTGAMVGAMLGLLAFMLAFTFGVASSFFQARREVVLSEANAIGTTYLRAAMLPAAIGTDVRHLLREYVDVRLEAATGINVAQAVSKSEELHGRLWSQAVAASENDRSPVTALFIESLNEVIDLHAKRVMAALRTRVPPPIWVALYLLAILSMAAMGYNQGLTSRRRSLAGFALILAFSVVLLLIVDLDRPGEGLLRVSQQSMIDLQNSMR